MPKLPHLPQSYLERSFEIMARQYRFPPWEAEYEFHPRAKWRFDFAWPQERVAVEIEGLTAEGGRHQRRQGFLRDAEKYEAALRLRWTVYRVPGPWIATSRRRLVWRRQVIDTLTVLLARGGNAAMIARAERDKLDL